MEPITFKVYDSENEIEIEFRPAGEYTNYYEVNMFENPSGVGVDSRNYPDRLRVSLNIPKDMVEDLYYSRDRRFYTLRPECYQEFLKRLVSLKGTQYFIRSHKSHRLLDYGIQIPIELQEPAFTINDIENKARESRDYKLALQIAHHYINLGSRESRVTSWLCSAYDYHRETEGEKESINYSLYLSNLHSLSTEFLIFYDEYQELLDLAAETDSIRTLWLTAPYYNSQNIARFIRRSKYLEKVDTNFTECLCYKGMYPTWRPILESFEENTSVKTIELTSRVVIHQEGINILSEALSKNTKSRVRKIILQKNGIRKVPDNIKNKVSLIS